MGAMIPGRASIEWPSEAIQSITAEGDRATFCRFPRLCRGLPSLRRCRGWADGERGGEEDLFFGAEHEAGAAAGVDEGDEVGAFDFFAEVADVDVDDVAAGGGVHGVEGFPDFAAGDELAGLEGKEFEEGVFAWGEGDAFAGAGDAAGGGVDFEVVDDEHGIFGVVLAADEGADAGFEFAEDAGFGDVVIGAGVEAADAVFGVVLAGEDDDVGGDAFFAHLVEEGEAVDVREAEVEDDDFVLAGGGEAVAGGAVFGDIDGEAGLLEDGGDEGLDGLIIFDK
jgi:hypothetical protein